MYSKDPKKYIRIYIAVSSQIHMISKADKYVFRCLNIYFI